MQMKKIRDHVVRALKEVGDFVSAEIDGHYFSGAEVAMKNENGNLELFRIAVIKHCSTKKTT